MTEHPRKARAAAFAVGLLLTLAGAALADRPTVATTARAIGLGGTATALADDASAAFWNPSGIPMLQRQELTFSYADRYGMGLKNSYTSFITPLFERHAIGVDWFRESFGDDELTDALNIINLTYGLQLHRALSVGVGSKFVFQTIDLYGTTLRNASGVGFDAGILLTPKIKPFDKFRLGATVQDISGTSLRDKDSQFEEEIFPQTLRVGAAFQPRSDLSFAVDVDDRVYVGAEYQPLASLILRGGMNRDLSPPDDASGTLTYALGLGLRWTSIKLDYAYEHHPVLPATHHAAVSLSYNASLVSIKEALVRHEPVFKSLYRTYEESEFVDVVLKNAAQDPLSVTVSIEIPTLTKTPHEETVTLPPQSTDRYGFKLTFPQDLLSTQSSYYDNLVQPVVKVSYAQGRRTKTATKRMNSTYVLGKGKLSWNNSKRVAAFVTSQSRTVEDFARGVVGDYADLLREKFPKNNIGKAALVFDALSAYGIRYQTDQATPFVAISGDDTVFDTVKYPYEFMESKIGDCDDCTTLFCSMLENINIPTAALDVFDPEFGHIFMMFDSGISISDAGDFFLNEKEYVIWEGGIWIPVETTLFGQSFSDAWRNGCDQYHLRKERGYIKEIRISDAQQTFRPGVVPDLDLQLPDRAAIDKVFERDVQYFDSRLVQIATASGVSLDSAEGLYDAGATYLRLGQLDRALESFDRALAMDSGMADAYNAKGVVFTRRSEYDKAIAMYEQALALNPTDAGFRINIALTYHIQGKSGDAQQAYDQAVQTNRDFAGMFDFLTREGGAPARTGAPSAIDPLQQMAAEKAYDDGAALLRLKAFDKAVEAFDRALSLDARNADALNGKGVVATHKSDHEGAAGFFQKALALDPQNAGFHGNLAIVYHIQGKKEDAVGEYARAAQIEPDYRGQLDFITGGEPLPELGPMAPAPKAPARVGALQRMAAEKAYDDGAAFLRLKAFDKALEAFDRALSLDPQTADALNGKGVVATHKSDHEGAAGFFQKALAIESENAGYHSNLAIVYHIQGRKEDAVAEYARAVRIDPDYRGQLDFITGGEPLPDTRPAAPEAPRRVSALQRMAAERTYDEGAALLRLRAWDKAVEAFARALSLDPDNADALNGKGVAATRQRDYDRAVDLYDSALAQDPENAGFHFNLAITYQLQGKAEEARVAYRKAVALDSSYEGELEGLEE